MAAHGFLPHSFFHNAAGPLFCKIGITGVIGVRTPNGFLLLHPLLLRVIPPPTISALHRLKQAMERPSRYFGTNFINILSVTAANMRLTALPWRLTMPPQRLTAARDEIWRKTVPSASITILLGAGKRSSHKYAGGDRYRHTTVFICDTKRFGRTTQEGDEITLAVCDVSDATQALFSLTVTGVGQRFPA